MTRVRGTFIDVPVHSRALVVFRLALLVALTVSAALWVDYSSFDVPYCSQAGCMAVRRYGFWLGVSVPLLGVIALFTTYALSLAVHVPGIHSLVRSLGIAAGLTGLTLLAVQAFVVGAFCAPCVIVDIAAVVAGAAAALDLVAPPRALALRPVDASPGDPSTTDPLRSFAWALLGLLAFGAPVLWPHVAQPSALPAPLLGHQAAGRITVLEFSDFQCSHCRALYPRLRALLAAHARDAQHVHLYTPLAGHTHSRPAARLALCSEAQGRSEFVIERLFSAPSLDEGALRRIARVAGLDLAELDRCLADPQTDSQLDANVQTLRDTGLFATPTVFIGRTRISGAQKDAAYLNALEQARSGGDSHGIPAPAYLAGVVTLAAGVILLGRRRRPGGPVTDAPSSS
jgi:predicted DsbA family dithiol-disulfide isomerase